MHKLLPVALKLRWKGPGDNYEATVETTVPDSCYKAKSIKKGLEGMMGIPEIQYVTADLSHEGAICADVIGKVKQTVSGLRSGGHPMGVVAVVRLKGKVIGTASKRFPRR